MSETKWTPGPWRRAGGGIVAVSNHPNLETVCLLERPPDEDFDRRRWVCNARLIAAAPDLYEALANIENDDGCIPPAIWAMRNAALAKARGDS